MAVLRSDNIFGPRLSNCWLPAETFAKSMVLSGHVDASLVVDARSFNIAMSSSAIGAVMTRFDGLNHTGVSHISYGKQHL